MKKPPPEDRQTDESVLVGRISGVYGLRGWLKIYSHTEPPEQILRYQSWQIEQQGRRRKMAVVSGRRQGKGIIAQLQSIEDRDQARSLVGAGIWIDKSQLPELEEGEYYWHQLCGLDVVNCQDQKLGVVDYLFATGANDVMVVKSGDGEQLIPFVVGAVVKNVDLIRRSIRVDWQADY